MAKLLEDRVAFITGGAGGIGVQIARDLGREGARVSLSDLDGPALAAAVATLTGEGLQVIAAPCDVTREDQLNAVLDACAARWGRLDVLVNNAGLQHVAPLESFPTEKFELLLKIMLVAPFIATKRVFPLMKRQGWGRVVNVASINGLVGFAGKAGYNSAKHGLLGLTKVAALEGAEHGITVDAVCPGYVDTPLVRGQLADLARTRGVALEKVLEEVIYPLVPMRRLMSVEDVSAMVTFIASDRAAFVTGVPMIVDGGYTAQ
jgi:3-hydroxybutyrate dehydrogenase